MNEDPKTIMKLYADKTAYDDTGLHWLFGMQRNSVKYLIRNVDSTISVRICRKGIDGIKYLCEIDFTLDEFKTILSLYPQSRIGLVINAKDDFMFGATVTEILSDMVSNHILGCRWPMYQDDINITEFTELLKKQAALLGYKLTIPLAKT